MKTIVSLFTLLAVVTSDFDSLVFHQPIEISDQVTLEDGSVWAIRDKDASAIYRWQETDKVVITQNSSFFSDYEFVLINQNLSQSVQANLSSEPLVVTHHITAFNDQLDYITLDDGSIWSISYFDHSSMMCWCVDDPIIIGVNQGWDHYIRPHILINTALKKYMRASNVQ